MFGKHSFSKTKKKQKKIVFISYLQWIPSFDYAKEMEKIIIIQRPPSYVSVIYFIFFPLRHEKSLSILDP